MPKEPVFLQKQITRWQAGCRFNTLYFSTSPLRENPPREAKKLRSTCVMSAMLLKSSANLNGPHPLRSLDSIPKSHLIC